MSVHVLSFAVATAVALLLLAQDGGEPPGKALAAAHPYLVTNPPLTQEDHRVFAALRKMCSMDAESQPLTQFAENISRLIGVPVRVDSRALRQEKPIIDPEVGITAQYEKTALLLILWEVLPKHHLDYRVVAGELVITTETQACQHLVNWTFPVADLCASDAEFNQLTRKVLGMTPEADWEAVGGFASFMPDPANRRFTLIHKQSSQDRVLYFLTQQRLARRGR
jgi:hypothetical protein